MIMLGHFIKSILEGIGYETNPRIKWAKKFLSGIDKFKQENNRPPSALLLGSEDMSYLCNIFPENAEYYLTEDCPKLNNIRIIPTCKMKEYVFI